MDQEYYCLNGHWWDTLEDKCPKCAKPVIYKHSINSTTGMCGGITLAGASFEICLTPERVINPRLILYQDLISQLYHANTILTNQAANVIESLLMDLYKRDYHKYESVSSIVKKDMYRKK